MATPRGVKGANIAPCRAAIEEYDLLQGSRRFDCSSLCCARFLTLGVSASILGVCPRHLPTRFTLTRVVQHAWKHFAPQLRALGRTQELAASRTASKTKVISPTGRISFAKIAEPMEVPDLLDLQIDSFDWLVGNEAWRDRVSDRTGPRAAPTSTPSPAWRRSSRRSLRSRTSPAPCRCRSVTTGSSRRRTPSMSARTATSPTPPRCSSPPSS